VASAQHLANWQDSEYLLCELQGMAVLGRDPVETSLWDSQSVIAGLGTRSAEAPRGRLSEGPSTHARKARLHHPPIPTRYP